MSQNNSHTEIIDAVLLRTCTAREAVSAVAAAAAPLLVDGGNDNGSAEAREMNDVEDELTPIEAAKLNVTVAYSIASLYYMLLRAKGEAQQAHPIRSEIERVRMHVERIRKAGLDPSLDSNHRNGGSGASSIPQKSFVDTTVIKRTIGHELGIKGISKTSDDIHTSKSTKKRKM